MKKIGVFVIILALLFSFGFVLAEDEQGSPWEPYHVEHGFSRDTSTVTVGGTYNWGFQSFPIGNDSEKILKNNMP